jgi:hypothetical protein
MIVAFLVLAGIFATRCLLLVGLDRINTSPWLEHHGARARSCPPGPEFQAEAARSAMRSNPELQFAIRVSTEFMAGVLLHSGVFMWRKYTILLRF